MVNNRTYHIIGAGIAGLYTAKLIKTKFPLSTIILYEASQHVGGRCGSYFSSDFNCDIDYATHVVLNKNKLTRQLLGKSVFVHPINFWSFTKNTFIPKLKCLPEIFTAIFNTSRPAWSCVFYVWRKLFPLRSCKAYFSCGTLQSTLCDPLLVFANDIKYGYKWLGHESSDKRLTKLIFNQETINLSAQDVVISAIDSFNYHKIMNTYDFDYHAITNIFYRTSMALSLPKNLKMLGIKNAVSQWVFCHSDYLSVTISQSFKKPDIRHIWKEICDIRHYNSAFLPIHKIHYFPHATIQQDAKNNAKRPVTAQTPFKNLLICGDWTMKNQPCCIETALQSAKRVIKFLPH